MNVFSLTQSLRDRRWAGYLIAVGALSLSLGMRYALGEAASKFPFVIFLPPVILTTFIGGIRPGVMAAVIAGVVAHVTIIAPEAGRLLPMWPDGWLALMFYAATVSVDIALIHWMTMAFRRAAVAETALRQANEALETRVAQRTAALRQQIGEREAAEAQVRQMQKMESVGQLTGGIAHDFNNMLAVIMGSLEMARRRLDDRGRLLAYIDDASEGAKRAAQLVSRLLAFSRQQELDPRDLDLNRLVASMSDLLRRTIGEQIVIETRSAEDAWQCFADAIQIENAVLNLAVNARDAMSAGGTLTIATTNVHLDAAYVRDHPDAVPGHYVSISVSDTGVGMPPAVLERAFDPFFTTKGVGKGTGLGLSQVYGFVTQSGGHVAVTSQQNVGTTIKLYLPRHAGDATAIKAEVEEQLVVPTATPEEIVLVVEDDPGVRNVSGDALRELGYAVVQAPDAEQALNILERQPQINLLFTDVIMPTMSGEQLAEAARALRPDLKVLFTTGYARNALNAVDLSTNDVALLPKPFTLSQLALKVRRLLDPQTAE